MQHSDCNSPLTDMQSPFNNTSIHRIYGYNFASFIVSKFFFFGRSFKKFAAEKEKKVVFELKIVLYVEEFWD